jgi:thiol-disulfide isomerase/thioredoxin
MWRNLAMAAIAVAFAAAGMLVYQWQHGGFEAGPDPVVAGQRLLSARLNGLDGKPQSIDQWQGKVLVVNFWATWCTPCREEIPEFIKYQTKFAANGVQFVGIAVDTAERVALYAKEMGINYPLLVGGIETMDLAREVGDRAGVLPFSLIIDRRGRVVATVVGILKPERLEKELPPLFQQPL